MLAVSFAAAGQVRRCWKRSVRMLEGKPAGRFPVRQPQLPSSAQEASAARMDLKGMTVLYCAALALTRAHGLRVVIERAARAGAPAGETSACQRQALMWVRAKIAEAEAQRDSGAVTPAAGVDGQVRSSAAAAFWATRSP